MTGREEVTTIGQERVRAFVPHPLPPDPPVVLGGALDSLLEQASLALGRLDSVSTLLPDTSLFLYAYIRKEAVLSSQIEGTQSSLFELLLFEMDEAPGVPREDVAAVSRYVAAMEHGLERIRGGFPLSNRLIREIHAILLEHGRGSGMDPGSFRRTQNWIGGARPGDALFVPPPPQVVADSMSDLERFLHAAGPELPVLARTGLAHAQFETIHPFLDGNGRVGRLLITFLLCEAGVLQEPLLYLSLYFKQHRDAYYELLNDIRRTGDWEAWLSYFFEGVRATADGATVTARRLVSLFEEDQERIRERGRIAGSALRVHAALKQRPILSIREAVRKTGLSFPAASSAMDVLGSTGLVQELTGKRRNRFFGYDAYLRILGEGTEPV